MCAFAKKLARVALVSPPNAGLFVIPFIYNLVRRQPECLFLIHRSNLGEDLNSTLDSNEEIKVEGQSEAEAELEAIKDVSRLLALGSHGETKKKKQGKNAGREQKSKALADDPFDEFEPDPRKSRALESQLWELEALQRHYCPPLSSLANSVFSTEIKKERFLKADLPVGDFATMAYSDLMSEESKRVQAFPLNDLNTSKSIRKSLKRGVMMNACI